MAALHPTKIVKTPKANAFGLLKGTYLPSALTEFCGRSRKKDRASFLNSSVNRDGLATLDTANAYVWVIEGVKGRVTNGA
jgi:hypothetical protein